MPRLPESGDRHRWRKRQVVRCENSPQPVRIVADDAGHPHAEETVHLARLVDGPRDHTNPKRIGLRYAPACKVLECRRPDGTISCRNEPWHRPAELVHVESCGPWRGSRFAPFDRVLTRLFGCEADADDLRVHP